MTGVQTCALPISTISEEKLKSGEIAYKLNGEKSDGTWGQVIGTEDYPDFRKYSKTVYYDPATQTYSCLLYTSHSITDGRRQEARPAYPVLQNYDQPGNQIDTEQFHRIPGEYGNRSQHMKHRIG